MDMDPPEMGDGVNPASSSLSAARTMDHSFVLSHESEEMAVPLRHGPKLRKALAADKVIELRKSETKNNDNCYLKNMLAATKQHLNYQLQHQARKNAEHFILGRGLNGIGTFSHPNFASPLALFAGQGLYEWIFGNQDSTTSSKRPSPDGEDSDSRRVRPRQDDWDPTSFDDIDAILRMDDDMEVARHAGTELEDISSALMPWTVSASKRGSSMSRLGLGSAARRSRLVSASPLQSRGQTMAPMEEIDLQMLDEELILETDPEGAEAINFARTEKIEAALDKDGRDFLIFIENEITAKQADEEQIANQLGTGARDIDSITFEELMAPTVHEKKTAARGFLVVCSLATKNLIHVEQEVHFGDIVIGLV
jgi:hypothetical protein